MALKSQLRQHLKFSWKNYFRYYVNKMRIGYLGSNVYIDNNVKFMRFPKNISIDNEVIVKEGVRICSCNKSAEIKIGARTTIGYHTFIFASEKIEIGNDSLIAPFVYIVDSNHQTKRNININIQPNITASIKIGNDVWVGSNVTILKGVIIGDGAVIAANSVVNNNVLSNEIWGGIPAKKIGERKI